MYKLFMAFRYLRAHKIIYFSIAGVAIGIMTMVIVTSIMSGFARDMRTRIRGMQTHIVVQHFWKGWLPDYEEMCDVIEKVEHVEGCAPRIEYNAWLGRSGLPRMGVRMVGIDPERERGVSEIEDYFRKSGKLSFDFEPDPYDPRRHRREELRREGKEPDPGIVLGSEIHGGLRAGLITARDDVIPYLANQSFEQVGSFQSGMVEYDSKYVFMHLEEAQKFLDLPGTANVLAVAVDDYEAHGLRVRAEILKAIHEWRECENERDHNQWNRCGSFRTITWEQARRILLQAVEIEKAIQILILFLIILVAGFNIIAIYTLVVRSKSRDIGIMRALGATEEGVTSIFLMSGGLCGLFGSIFGIFLGLLLSYNINEIADFVRVASRDLNRMPRGELAAVVVLSQLAWVSLIWTWWVFYRQRRPHPWVRIAVTGALLFATTWFATGWLPEYQQTDPRYDPDVGPGLRWILLIAVPGLWFLLTGAWRFLDRWRRHPSWTFFGFVGTVILILFHVAINTVMLMSDWILATRPDYSWPGLELFSRKIYYLDRIPVYVDFKALGYIVAVTIIVSVIFSIYPALRAAAANPIDAMRDEA